MDISGRASHNATKRCKNFLESLHRPCFLFGGSNYYNVNTGDRNLNVILFSNRVLNFVIQHQVE